MKNIDPANPAETSTSHTESEATAPQARNGGLLARLARRVGRRRSGRTSYSDAEIKYDVERTTKRKNGRTSYSDAEIKYDVERLA